MKTGLCSLILIALERARSPLRFFGIHNWDYWVRQGVAISELCRKV
jgi:hypothetical protein